MSVAFITAKDLLGPPPIALLVSILFQFVLIYHFFPRIYQLTRNFFNQAHLRNTLRSMYIYHIFFPISLSLFLLIYINIPPLAFIWRR